MTKDLKTLTPKDLTDALANSGYGGCEFRTARFDGFAASGDAIYTVTFLSEDTDEIEDGYIYVSRDPDGRTLLGEF
jgi:hypothetical protein